jgi:hypothetical protein
LDGGVSELFANSRECNVRPAFGLIRAIGRAYAGIRIIEDCVKHGPALIQEWDARECGELIPNIFWNESRFGVQWCPLSKYLLPQAFHCVV